jgi:hypothetical protein
MTITGTPNTKVQPARKRKQARPSTGISLTATGTPRQKKKRNSVRFSPKKKTYLLADNYDQKPPELDVFDCDGCAIKILGERHHCQQCDFDLCPNCARAPKVKMQQEHDGDGGDGDGDGDGVNGNDNDR